MTEHDGIDVTERVKFLGPILDDPYVCIYVPLKECICGARFGGFEMDMDNREGYVECPQCGRRYTWRPRVYLLNADEDVS